jgi:hypothetical protein
VTNRKEMTIEALYSEVDISVGEFDYALWKQAQPIQIASLWSGEEAPTSRHAESRVIWTDEALVVRFDCNQSEPLVVSETPELTKKTIGLWDRDVCEIFVAPDTSKPNSYYEFEAAPTGEWVDLAIKLGPTERYADEGFHSGMTTMAQITGSKLTIIISIPWGQAISKPVRGYEWRVNLFRCIGTGTERYLAWRPTYTPEPNFHVPEAFGWLLFI